MPRRKGQPDPRKSSGNRRKKVLARRRALHEPCWMCKLPIDWGAHHLHPHAFEGDDLDPVSLGGDPFDFDNIAASHKICNQWRGAKPVPVVKSYIRAARKLGTWQTPEEFVALCRLVKHVRVKMDEMPRSREW